MRIIRDYTCDHCGATIERASDSNIPITDDSWPHANLVPCSGRLRAHLSATATTFKFADTSAQKHRQ